jgi:hypothetical protein
VQSKVLTGSVTSQGDTWTEILQLSMPNGLKTPERWAGIGTLESRAPSGASYAQEFAINAYPNSTQITGAASTAFGTGLSATGGLAVTTPPQLRATTGAGQTYLSVEVKGEALPAPSSSTLKAFYSWADTIDGGATANHTAIVDQAKLTGASEIGAMTTLFPPFSNLPPAEQYNTNGVLMRNGVDTAPGVGDPAYYYYEGLMWPASFLNGTDTGAPAGLATDGFTMHYEIESEVFEGTETGAASGGTFLGILQDVTNAPSSVPKIAFNREAGVSGWTSFNNDGPVTTTNDTAATHLNYDLSFTKLTVGYRMDVYIERTLWFTSTNAALNTTTLNNTFLYLAGIAGFGPSHPNARIRHALLIRGPVDPYAGLTVSAVGVGDSNMTFPSLQGPGPYPSSTNNPLTWGQINTVALNLPNIGPGPTGNSFLNSALQDKGISITDGYTRIASDPGTEGSVMNRIFDASVPGRGILPDLDGDHWGRDTLVTIVDEQLSPTVNPPANLYQTLAVATIDNTSFSVTCTDADIHVGDEVQITGTLSGGTITGYTSGTYYNVKSLDAGTAPNITSFTLVENDLNSTPVGTTAGSASSLTFTLGPDHFLPSRQPTNPAQWWFCNMGGNDLLKRSRVATLTQPLGPNLNGFPDTTEGENEWVTYLCTKYLVQIDRMLASSSDAKVFIVGPTPMYNMSTSTEIFGALNAKISAEYLSRIPNHSPGRVFYRDQYTNSTWSSIALLYSDGIHLSSEGYRQLALEFSRMVPQNGESGILRHRLTYDYNDISGI